MPYALPASQVARVSSWFSRASSLAGARCHRSSVRASPPGFNDEHPVTLVPGPGRKSRNLGPVPRPTGPFRRSDGTLSEVRRDSFGGPTGLFRRSDGTLSEVRRDSFGGPTGLFWRSDGTLSEVRRRLFRRPDGLFESRPDLQVGRLSKNF